MSRSPCLPPHPPLTRRDFNRLALLTILSAAGLLLDACQPRPASSPTPMPAPTRTPAPAPTRTPGVTATPAPSPDPTATPTATLDPRQAVFEEHRSRIEEIIRTGTDHYARLVVRPLAAPQLEVNHRGDEFQRAASTIKALILIYALFKNPALDLHGWEADRPAADAYRMIVSSNNGATARVLVDAVGGHEHRTEALDAFNDFIHTVLGVPPAMGLTRWNYWPTGGVETDRLTEPVTDEFPEGIPNPITLNALADFFTLLETPDALRAAAERAADLPGFRDPQQYPTRDAYCEAVLAGVDRAKALMSIPDPDYVTQMDLALAAARQRYPHIAFQMYGKNGTISPADWSLNRWHINEAVVLTLDAGGPVQKFVVAFSSASFDTEAMLNAAMDYCVALAEAAFV